jgi:cytochrome P450
METFTLIALPFLSMRCECLDLWLVISAKSARMEWQWLLPSARGDERWRRNRRLLDRGLRPGAAALHRPMLQTRARVLLSRLLTNPQQWEAHIDLSAEIPATSHCVTELL